MEILTRAFHKIVESFHSNNIPQQFNRKDFSVMMRQCYPTADTDKLEKHIFRMYDANNDGKIDFK